MLHCLVNGRKSVPPSLLTSTLEQQLVEAASLLSKLLLQDVERRGDGVAVKDGVAPDRIVSVHDPEMRRGHKSRTQTLRRAQRGRGGGTGEPSDYGRRRVGRQCFG